MSDREEEILDLKLEVGRLGSKVDDLLYDNSLDLLTAQREGFIGIGKTLADHQLVNQNSGNVELYTPPHIVEAEYPLPNRKYSIIYADPPWSYRDKATAGKRGAGYKYPTQSKEWLRELNVRGVSNLDCALFLWVTMPLIDEGLELIKAWGFSYKTCAFTWVKRNKIAPSWFFGMGNWTRSNAELCLLGIKGNIRRVNAGVSSVIDTPIESHSKKPAIVREKIVSLMGDLPRIELFARQKTDGWDVWGNEVV